MHTCIGPNCSHPKASNIFENGIFLDIVSKKSVGFVSESFNLDEELLGLYPEEDLLALDLDPNGKVDDKDPLEELKEESKEFKLSDYCKIEDIQPVGNIPNYFKVNVIQSTTKNLGNHYEKVKLDVSQQDPNEFILELKGENKPFKCLFDGCNLVQSKHKLIEHLKLTHKISKDPIPNYVCKDGDCNYQTVNLASMKIHLKLCHNLFDSLINEFACSDKTCNYVTINMSNIKTHLKDIHEISESSINKYTCNQTDCSYQTLNEYGIIQHLLYSHEISDKPIEKYKCVVENCSYETLVKGNYENHMRDVHKTSQNPIKEIQCDQPNCDYKTTNPQRMKRHLTLVHEISDKPIEMFKCNQPDCSFENKSKGNLVAHLRNVHKISDKPIPEFKCNQPNCEFTTPVNSKLTRHLKDVHKISNKPIETLTCQEENCDYETDNKGNMKRHLKEKHKISDKPIPVHKCPIENCSYDTVIKNNLNRHLEQSHDIGEHQCDFCTKNRNTSIEHIDKDGNVSHICRDCHDTVTGKKVRGEKEWSNFIDNNFGTEYLLSTDKALVSVGGCLLQRPDKLFTGLNTVLLLEHDENQHVYNNGTYQCEEKRISDMYGEEGICGKFMAVIRYNPDSYVIPTGKKRLKKADRLALMVKVMKYILEHPEALKAHIHVFYICYNQDNPKICKEFPMTMLYDESDLEKLNQ